MLEAVRVSGWGINPAPTPYYSRWVTWEVLWCSGFRDYVSAPCHLDQFTMLPRRGAGSTLPSATADVGQGQLPVLRTFHMAKHPLGRKGFTLEFHNLLPKKWWCHHSCSTFHRCRLMCAPPGPALLSCPGKMQGWLSWLLLWLVRIRASSRALQPLRGRASSVQTLDFNVVIGGSPYQWFLWLLMVICTKDIDRNSCGCIVTDLLDMAFSGNKG